MPENQTEGKILLRYIKELNPPNFEKCAFEHFFEPNLCPKPGINAEILKDYVRINNYSLKIIKSLGGGLTGGEEENRTTLRLLALNEGDFTAFDWSFIPERIGRFNYSFPILHKEFVAVIKNPAMNYVDLLRMPRELPLAIAAAVFFMVIWALRRKNLRLMFPIIYKPGIMLNWEIYNLIFSIILSYFTGITVEIMI